MKCFKNVVFSFSFFSLVFLGSVLVGQSVNASELVDQSQTLFVAGQQSRWIFQNFIPSSSNLSAVEFRLLSSPSNSTTTLFVCSGVASTSSSGYGCGSDFMVSVATTTITGSGIHKIDIEPVALVPGSPYYFVIYNPSNLTFYNRNVFDVSSLYSSALGGYSGLSLGYGYYYKTYYFDDLIVDTLRPLVSSFFVKANENYTFSFFYDFCGSYSSIQSVNISLSGGLGSSYVIKDKTVFSGPQNCSGIYRYTDLIDEEYFDVSSVSAVADIDDGLYITKLYSVPVPLDFSSSSNYIRSADINLTFDASATTTLHFLYNLSGLDWATSTVCLFNSSGINTGWCSSLSSFSGLGSVDIPPFPYLSSPLVDNYYFKALPYEYLTSSFFEVVWQQQSLGIPSTGLSFQSLYGSSIHDLVCSVDEWTSTSTFLGLNFTLLKCSTLETSISVAEKVGSFPLKLVKGLTYFLGKVFPISIATGFYNSWQSSATGSLPVAFSFIDTVITPEGNIYVPSFNPLDVSASSSSFCIFGPALISDYPVMVSFFSIVRSVSTYTIWIGFIYALYRVACGFTSSIAVKKYDNSSLKNFFSC